MHDTINVLVGAMKPLSLVNVRLRAEEFVKMTLKATPARLCLSAVALQFLTMTDQRQDDSKGSTHGHQLNRMLEIFVTGSTGPETRAWVDGEVLRQSLSHRGSAV
jgi:hypothetical protein